MTVTTVTVRSNNKNYQLHFFNPITSSTVGLIFFGSVLLILRWVKLVELYKVKVRLDINLGVPDKAMFTYWQALVMDPVVPCKNHTLDFGDHL